MTMQELLDRLEHIRQRSLHVHLSECHFGLLIAYSVGFDRSTWGRISKSVQWPAGGVILFRSDADWIDPDPSSDYATACLCWSGHRRVADELCAWAEDAVVAFKNGQNQLAAISSLNGHHGTFHTLCLNAMENAGLAHLINKEILFDGDALSKSGYLQSALRLIPDPPAVDYLSVTEDAIGFALEVMRNMAGYGESVVHQEVDQEADEIHLRVEPPGERKYSIYWLRSSGLVYLNDRPINKFLTSQHVRWLDSLLQAKGGYCSLDDVLGMEAKSLNPTRFRKLLPSQLEKLIQTKPGRGSRLRAEWLK